MSEDVYQQLQSAAAFVISHHILPNHVICSGICLRLTDRRSNQFTVVCGHSSPRSGRCLWTPNLCLLHLPFQSAPYPLILRDHRFQSRKGSCKSSDLGNDVGRKMERPLRFQSVVGVHLRKYHKPLRTRTSPCTSLRSCSNASARFHQPIFLPSMRCFAHLSASFLPLFSVPFGKRSLTW